MSDPIYLQPAPDSDGVSGEVLVRSSDKTAHKSRWAPADAANHPNLTEHENAGLISAVDAQAKVDTHNDDANDAAHGALFAAKVSNSVVDLRGKDIHAELLDLHDAGGGKAVIPMGTVVEVDDTVHLGARVRLGGDGIGAQMSVIRASASFPTDGRAIVRLDRAADSTIHAPGNLLSGIVVDCNNRAQVGVYSENVQEGGGVVDCQIINWTHKAVHFSGSKAMNFTMRDLWGYSSSSADPTGIGLHLDSCGSTNPVTRVTFVGSSSAAIATGMQVHDSRITLLDGHFEAATNGLLCSGSSVVRVLGATGHSSLPTVVRAQDTSRLFFVDVIADGSTNAVVDETGGTAVARNEPFGLIGSEQYIKGAASSRPAQRVVGSASTADVAAYAQSSGVDRVRVDSDGHLISVDRDIKRVGDGVGGWRLERADGTLRWAGYLRTDVSDEFRLQSGAEIKLRITHALGGGIGFNGKAPVKPTLPAAGTVTADDLRQALIDLGLCQ